MATAAAQHPPQTAVVQLAGCSGVCVTADGLILTADHCGSDRQLEVVFPDGRTHRATLVFEPPQNGVDECQAYQIDNASGLPFVNVATLKPKAGDAVWSVGYPFGNFQRNEGKVQRVGFKVGRDKRFQVEIADGVVTDWQSDGGNSGGPLFNAAGEVIGILSMSSRKEPRSYWIGGESIAIALTKRKAATGSRRLVMFGRKSCAACILYDKEIKRTGSPVLVIKKEDEYFAEWKKSYERHTGKELDYYPTFWVEGTAESREENYQPGLLQRIIGWFGNTVRGIVATFIGQPAEPGQAEVYIPPRPVPDESPNFDLPPTPTESLDPANITVVILAAMQDVGLVKGTALKLAIDKAEGPLTRAINEKIGARATLVLVPQRTQPERFAAVTNAARITANPAAVLVLVKAQSLGLKTLIAGKVESMLVGRIPDSIPVELIFERIHGKDFQTITRAVLTRETQNFQRSTPSSEPTVTEAGIVAKLMPLLKTTIGEKLAASDNALVAKLGGKLASETPPPDDGPQPIEQGMMGAMGLLVAERLRSMWIRRKTAKQADELDSAEATA